MAIDGATARVGAGEGRQGPVARARKAARARGGGEAHVGFSVVRFFSSISSIIMIRERQASRPKN